MKRKLYLILSLLVLASMVLAACGQPTPAPTQEPIPTDAPVLATHAPASTMTPTETPLPTPTLISPEVLFTSTFTIEAGRYEFIGDDMGATIAYDGGTESLVVIQKGHEAKVWAKGGDSDIELTIVDSNDLYQVAGLAETLYPDAVKKYWFMTQFDGLKPLWQNGFLPENWEAYFVPNPLRSRTDYDQSAVANPRLADALKPTATRRYFVQVTCNPYTSNPGVLAGEVRWNTIQMYQIWVVNMKELDLVQVCGGRPIAEGVKSVWANYFELTRPSGGDAEVGMRDLMADAIALYQSPTVDEADSILWFNAKGELATQQELAKAEKGELVLFVKPVWKTLLDGTTNYAQFVVGFPQMGIPSAPSEWAK